MNPRGSRAALLAGLLAGLLGGLLAGLLLAARDRVLPRAQTGVSTSSLGNYDLLERDSRAVTSCEHAWDVRGIVVVHHNLARTGSLDAGALQPLGVWQ